MKIVFFGFHKSSVSILEVIRKTDELVAIVVPRRKRSEVSDLASYAKKNNIKFFKPKNPNTSDFIIELKKLSPDLAIVHSYAKIFKKEIIKVFPKGMINYHGGILPAYRGANIINWTIIKGENKTGLSVHYIDESIDTGPIIGIFKIPINPNDSARDMQKKFIKLIPVVTKEVLSKIRNGKALLLMQNKMGNSQYFRKRIKEDGLINWRLSAVEIHNLIRALSYPWPGAYTFLKNKKIVLEKSRLIENKTKYHPGEILKISQKGLEVGSNRGKLLISLIRDGRNIIFPKNDFKVGDVFADRRKVVSIHQPNFMPWLGLLDKINRSDIFVIFDTSGVGKNSTVNRNLIKTPQGQIWLTVPIHSSVNQEFRTITIDNSTNWKGNHLKSLFYNYKKAPNFNSIYPKIEKIYKETYEKLIDLNMELLKLFLNESDIKVKIVLASDLKIAGEKNETLIGFIKKVGGKIYLAGDGSKDYVDESLFEKNGIKVMWQNFQHPKYHQLWGDFIPKLSAIDYLMCHAKKEIFYK